jgi:hypothetical protein
MKRLVALAILGMVLLGVGATALIYLGSQSAPPSARPVESATGGEPTALPPSSGTAAIPAPTPAPAVEARTGAQPPPMPSDADERSDRLLEFRQKRRDDGMDQLNAREAARRARLGLPPASPTLATRPPPPVRRTPGSP